MTQTATADVGRLEEVGDRTSLFKRDGWFKLYKGTEPKTKTVKCTGGVQGEGERIGIEVEVDGNLEETLRKGEEQSFRGKHIRLQATSFSASYTATDG
ncbi:MAG TPA: hypothetical protein VGG06_20280 [Thermoanaerobaculia bacterium]|jgi:hypothetical protein